MGIVCRMMNENGQLQYLQISTPMKQVPELTPYFLEQAPQLSPFPISPQIEAFQKSLLNLTSCPLCKMDYMVSDPEFVPRIVVHCGHTFCTACLKRFFLKDRIRCPMCLKLVKKVSGVEELPINHTIFAQLTQQLQPDLDPYKFLCTAFTTSCGGRLSKANPPETDEQSGLHRCCFHPEKIQHFFCIYHQVPGCRECMEVRHKRPECKLMDLYDMRKQSD